MNGSVLIIDDEDLFREDLASLLRSRGLTCYTAGTVADGLQANKRHTPDVILCDVVLPDGSGVDAVEKLKGGDNGPAVIMMTAYGSLETAVRAFRQGAADYVLKPLVIEDIVQKIGRVLRSRALTNEVHRLRSELAHNARAMVARSAAMQQVLGLIEKVAETRSTVLVTGETGTGKEVTARAIHKLGPSSTGPFVPVNCAAITESLMESELFGHERGAFTGAESRKIGFFEQAENGTLFLDEISELRLELQSKLLRVLDEKKVYRVGSTVAVPIDIQIIAASNREVVEEVEAGRFRQDLYYRLAVVELRVPALRERPEDIQPLAQQFLERFCVELKRSPRKLGDAALQALLHYRWPGNVRELQNAIERAVILGSGDILELDDLPPSIAKVTSLVSEAGSVIASSSPDHLRAAVRAFERAHIERVLEKAQGNREAAARNMGINPSTLYRKMADLGVHDS